MQTSTLTRGGQALAVVMALGTGVVLGMPQQGAEAQPPQTARVFSAAAGAVLSYVKTGQATSFESTMTRVGEALTTSENVDRRRQAAGWKIYKATVPLDGGVVLYISVLDPVIPGADYWVPEILNEGYPTEVQELYEAYTEAFADGQILLNLSPIVGS